MRDDNFMLTQTASDTPVGRLFRHFWLPALLSSELPRPDCPPVRVRILGENLVAFRDSDNRVGLLDAHCPHRRAELYYGRNEQGGLRCIYHGWKFDVNGSCVDIPTEENGCELAKSRPVAAYPVIEQGGDLSTRAPVERFGIAHAAAEREGLRALVLEDAHAMGGRNWHHQSHRLLRLLPKPFERPGRQRHQRRCRCPRLGQETEPGTELEAQRRTERIDKPFRLERSKEAV